MKKGRKNRQNQMKKLNLVMLLKAAKATTQNGKRKKIHHLQTHLN